MKYNYFKRILLWSLERFPPIQILSALLTFAIVCIPHKMFSGWLLFHGTFVVYSLLLTLRVLDEHKDFKNDLIAHPERLLQKNILSLKDLRILASLLILSSLFIIIFNYLTFNVLISLVFVIAWMILMTKEFFISEWLNRHLLMYSVSHLLISPLLIYLCAQIAGTAQYEKIYLMMSVSFLSAFSYEVARKIKGTDEKNLSESNYVNSYGINKPLSLFVFLSILDLAVSYQLNSTLRETSMMQFAIYTIAVCLILLSAFLFFKNPNKKHRKVNEGVAALTGLISFLIPLSILV